MYEKTKEKLAGYTLIVLTVIIALSFIVFVIGRASNIRVDVKTKALRETISAQESSISYLEAKILEKESQTEDTAEVPEIVEEVVPVVEEPKKFDDGQYYDANQFKLYPQGKGVYVLHDTVNKHSYIVYENNINGKPAVCITPMIEGDE